MLPRDKRQPTLAFYRFARAADDIADAADLDPATKINRLNTLEAALVKGHEPAVAANLRLALDATGVADTHARDLLAAFRQDTANATIGSWSDLMAYCALSAAPVGRFLLDLFGETDAAARPASDCLCAALQVLNHLTDIKSDARDLDRVYLPADQMAAQGLNAVDLIASQASPPLRGLIDDLLARTDGLLGDAAPLVAAIRSRSLRCQAALTLACAHRHLAKLRAGDSLASDLSLSRRDMVACLPSSIVRGLWP